MKVLPTNYNDAAIFIGIGNTAATILSPLKERNNDLPFLWIGNELVSPNLSEGYLSIEQVQETFWLRLKELIRKETHKLSANSNSQFGYLDVFVFGAFQDDEFITNLPQIIWITKTVGLHFFKALYGNPGNLQNANYFIHPIGISENLQLEKDKTKIINNLALIERYSTFTQTSKRCIPRFFLLDGFTQKASLTLSEQCLMLSSFFEIWMNTPIRRYERVNRLFHFTPYESDLFTFLNLAMIEFPIEIYKEYFASRLLGGYIDYLLPEEQTHEDSEIKNVRQVFKPFMESLDSRKLHSDFVEPIEGYNLNKRLAEAIPYFYYYIHQEYDQLREEEKQTYFYRLAKELYQQKTYLPRIKKFPPQESLSLFFTNKWMNHIEENLSPRNIENQVGHEVKKFYDELEKLESIQLDNFKKRLLRTVGQSIALNNAKNTLHKVLNYLRSEVLPQAQKLKGIHRKALCKELPAIPDFNSYYRLTTRFDSFIRRLTDNRTLFFWLCIYIILIYPVVTILLSQLQNSLTYDPLNPPFIVSLLSPPFVYGLSFVISATFYFSIFLFANYFNKRRIKRYLRSLYPELSKEFQTNGGITKRSLEKEQRKRGSLAEAIGQLREDIRIFWEKILHFYVHFRLLRVYTFVEKIVRHQINNLQTIINDVNKFRVTVQDIQRKYGEPEPEYRPVSVYPSNTAFHHYFLNTEWLNRLYVDRFQFKNEKDAFHALFRKIDLKRFLRKQSLPLRLEYVKEIIFGLFSLSSEEFNRLLDFSENHHAVSEKLRADLSGFMKNLQANLGVGYEFISYAAHEHDLQIIDSGVFVFCDKGIERIVLKLQQSLELDLTVIPLEKFEYKTSALRLIEDISLKTLCQHMSLDEHYIRLAEKKINERVKKDLEPEQDSDDPWEEFYIQSSEDMSHD